MPDTFVLLAIISSLVVCLLTLLNTDFGLIFLILAMLLSPEFRMGAMGGGPGARTVIIRLDDIMLIVVFFTWLAKLAANKGLGLWKRTPLNTPIVTLIFFLTVSSILGIIEGRAKILPVTFYLLKYVEYYMIFFMVSNSIKSQRQIKVFVFFMLLTAVITCIYGLSVLRFQSRAVAPFEISAESSQGEPNTLGGYLVLIFSIVMGILLYSKASLFSLFLMLTAGLSLITLLHTLSRTSYLAIIAAILALTVLTTRQKWVLVFLIIVFIMSGMAFMPQKVINRISQTFVPDRIYEPFGIRIGLDYSAASRIESWKLVFPMWEMNPILGCGVTAVGLVDTQFPLMLGEGGIVGVGIFTWVVITIIRHSLKTLKTIEDDYSRGLALGFTAGYVGLLMHAFGAASFILIRIAEPFWFLTAIIMMLPQVQEAEKQVAIA